MARTFSNRTRPKVKIGVSLDPDLYEWLLGHVGPGGEFASVSHAIERSVALYQARRGDASSPPAGAT